jgi:hypothetical protein
MAFDVPPPQEPDELECCHRHCDPCIKDYYRMALERWKARAREAGADPEALLKGFGRD